jgi:hypothetical protein
VVSAILSVGGAVFLVLAWDTPMRPTEFGTKGYARVVTSSATRRSSHGERSRASILRRKTMTDRVAALGDSILVGSEPGRGTTVSGGIPTRRLAEVTG